MCLGWVGGDCCIYGIDIVEAHILLYIGCLHTPIRYTYRYTMYGCYMFHCFTALSVQHEGSGRAAALPHQDEGGEKGKKEVEAVWKEDIQADRLG